jgi:hypothetical protein
LLPSRVMIPCRCAVATNPSTAPSAGEKTDPKGDGLRTEIKDLAMDGDEAVGGANKAYILYTTDRKCFMVMQKHPSTLFVFTIFE